MNKKYFFSGKKCQVSNVILADFKLNEAFLSCFSKNETQKTLPQ